MGVTVDVVVVVVVFIVVVIGFDEPGELSLYDVNSKHFINQAKYFLSTDNRQWEKFSVSVSEMLLVN